MNSSVRKSRSGSSQRSEAIRRKDVSHTTENDRMEKEFRDTRTDMREEMLRRPIIPEVKDSGLDYTRLNLTTIENIDEEIIKKPAINVSVLGRIDNLKVEK